MPSSLPFYRGKKPRLREHQSLQCLLSPPACKQTSNGLLKATETDAIPIHHEGPHCSKAGVVCIRVTGDLARASGGGKKSAGECRASQHGGMSRRVSGRPLLRRRQRPWGLGRRRGQAEGSAREPLGRGPCEVLAVRVDFCEVGDHVRLSPPLALSAVSGTQGVPHGGLRDG